MHVPAISSIGLLLAVALLTGCGERPPAGGAPSADATSATPAKPESDQAPAAADPPVQPQPASEATEGYAPAPSVGHVIRANCKMGGCWWYRYEAVQREDAMPPRYRLQVRVGDSGPHPDPYPLAAEGVDIRWDAQPMAEVEVSCSREAPRVRIGDADRTLALGPDGVHGVDQGLANLYFASCHGEQGDDSVLARRFGYGPR